MTMVEKLLELAERCEKAHGPDRELDAAIAVTALGFYVAEPRYEGAPVAYGYVDENGSRVEPGHGGDQLIREFTASLDAAMTLVPDHLVWSINTFKNPPKASAYVMSEGGTQWRCEEYQATPALALCAAALRARAS